MITVTGHRPNKLGGYSDDVYNRLITLAEKWVSNKEEMVLTGMALGWDQACAQACLNKGTDYTAVIPFEGQEKVWPATSRRKWAMLVGKATEQVVVSTGSYAAWKMHRRNEWMVNKSDMVIALWDGVKQGGTWKCIEYALKKDKEVFNLWGIWTGKSNDPEQIIDPQGRLF